MDAMMLMEDAVIVPYLQPPVGAGIVAVMLVIAVVGIPSLSRSNIILLAINEDHKWLRLIAECALPVVISLLVFATPIFGSLAFDLNAANQNRDAIVEAFEQAGYEAPIPEPSLLFSSAQSEYYADSGPVTIRSAVLTTDGEALPPETIAYQIEHDGTVSVIELD